MLTRTNVFFSFSGSNYLARNTRCLETQPVTSKNKPMCYTCAPDGSCTRIKKFKRLFVERFGALTGYDAMKREIFERGPISCSIDSTDDMDDYTGGIYAGINATLDDTDHVISVVGWTYDEASGNEAWVYRNSWGSAWGEDGFMRIVTSRNKGTLGTANNAIETLCGYGVVTKSSFRYPN